MNRYPEETIELFHALLRSAISTGETVRLPESEETIRTVLALGKAQNVLLLICYGIEKNDGIIPDEFKKDRIKALYHYAQNEYALKIAKDTLEDGQIPYVPLKGATIKNLYPEQWMRQCIDIDILVHDKDIENAVLKLEKAGFKTNRNREYHDVSLYYGDAHLELHFSICENIPRIDTVLDHIWKYTEHISEYEYGEVNEFFAFHNVAHMLYHFLRGGCNIKPFVDLWILRHNNIYDEKKLQPLLSACKLEQFYQVICEFTDCIFTGGHQTELFQKIETQILSGGITQRNEDSDRISIRVTGSLKKYIFKSIFLPRREMEWIYPTLRKHPILLLYYYNKRLITKTVGKEKKRVKDVLKAHKKPTDEMEKLLIKMGL